MAGRIKQLAFADGVAVAGAITTTVTSSLTSDVIGILPVANGGTNSGTALSNNRVIMSISGALAEASAITANRALISDSNGAPIASSTTATELGYVAGVTSAIQTQLGTKLALAGGTMSGNIAMGGNKVTGLGSPSGNGDALRYDQLGANSGIATLDSGGKIPLAQLPASLMEYQGTWNANTNSPSLADGSGTSGFFYRVQTAGTQNLGSGSQTFVVGDWVMYNGSIWQLAHSGADAVVSVAGKAGVVTLAVADINSAELSAVDALSTTGLVARTASATYTPRTLTAGSSKLAVTNGNGVSGNPTVDVTEANLTLSNMGGTVAVGHGGTGATTAAGAEATITPLTTKGDINVYSTLSTRLGVGSDGQVLSADSTQTTGLKWIAGGLTNPMTTLGDLISGGASGAATRLAGDTSNTRKFLRSVSSAGTATAPAWDTIAAGDLPVVTQSAAGAVSSAGQLLGTNTNDTASAGNVGETKQDLTATRANPSAISTGSSQSICNITLTAGHWLVFGSVGFNGGAATVVTDLRAEVSTSTNALNNSPARYNATGQNGSCFELPDGGVNFNNGDISAALPMIMVFVANGNTQTLYVVAKPSFTGVSTINVYGKLEAVRIR